jgi:site-specific DNA recombinase
VSTVHTILSNRLYTGWFEWNGMLYEGKHEALVPADLWERGAGRAGRPLRQESQARVKRPCLLGPDRMRKMWLRGGRRDQEAAIRLLPLHRIRRQMSGTPASRRRTYVREEMLEAKFTELLGSLKFNEEVLE